MSKWMWLTILAAGVAMILGCSQQPSGTAAMIEDKTYTVTPAVKAGIVTGEVTEMKVTERVEKGSDRVVSPAKLTGTLKLKNTSANQTVRLVAGKILYIDAQGQPIKLEESRTEPVVKFATYGSERLDPGQDATQSLDVEFSRRGPESEEAEGDPTGARVHPVTVPGGEYQLHRVDRCGQGSQGSARFLCWERENTMRPMTGLNEPRDQNKLTWIAQEHGWVATPEDIVTALSRHGPHHSL